MPVILNIETSTDVCSVALTCDGQVVFNKENHESMSHASSLGGYVQDALSVAKSHHFAIDAVAVSRGPGSYTGLRIGVSEAKGLCFGLDVPLIAVDTLAVITCAVMFKKDIDEDFRGIKSITVIPDRIYQENQYLIEAITSVLDTPYVDSNIRRILKAKLADITLNLNLYSDRRKLDGVDLNCINDRLDIHRTCLLYDFDEMTGRGMGLSLTKYDDEWNFI